MTISGCGGFVDLSVTLSGGSLVSPCDYLNGGFSRLCVSLRFPRHPHPGLLPCVPSPSHAPRCAFPLVQAHQPVPSARKRFIGLGETWPARGCRAQCTLGLIVEPSYGQFLRSNRELLLPACPARRAGRRRWLGCLYSTTPSLRFCLARGGVKIPEGTGEVEEFESTLKHPSLNAEFPAHPASYSSCTWLITA